MFEYRPDLIRVTGTIISAEYPRVREYSKEEIAIILNNIGMANRDYIEGIKNLEDINKYKLPRIGMGQQYIKNLETTYSKGL